MLNRKQFAYAMFQKFMDLVHPGRKKRYRKQYLSRHRFEIAMHKQLLRLAFPVETRIADKKRRSIDHPNHATRKECLRKANQRYYRKYPDRVLAQCRVYQARKFGSQSGDLKAITEIYQRARELRQWFDVVVDHVIPLKKGGTHSADNLQIIYAKENRQKWDRLDYTPLIIFL